MAIAQTPLIEELQALVGADHAFAPRDGPPFVVDGVVPSVIVMPASYEEVAAVMRFANNSRLSVIPQSHGAVTWIGNIPGRYDVALSVSRLNAIVEYEPADLTITCQAGATLDDLRGPLGQNGQILPFALKGSPSCVGRLLAHPMRESNLTWGTARDFTIGMRVVTADGRIIRTGGNVVKNVAGYDLTKLFIGSMGSLGVIVEATFKLAPAPQAEERLDLEFVSIAEASAFASKLSSAGLSLRYVKLNRSMSITEAGPVPRPKFRLRIEFAGTAPAVERSHRDATEFAAAAGGSREATEWPRREGPMPSWATAGDPMTCEARILPTRLTRLVDEFDRDAPGAFIEASPIEGVISFTWLGAGPNEDLFRCVRAITTRLGGTLVVTGCDTELKRKINVFGDPPPAFDLMRRVKQQFDPNGILSPGRFVGRL